MKKIKLLSLLLAAVISGTVLTSCGDSENSSASDTVYRKNSDNSSKSSEINDTDNSVAEETYEYDDTASYTIAKGLADTNEETAYTDEEINIKNNEIIKAVTDNENLWISNLNSYNNYINTNYTGASQMQAISSSSSYCWFQDMDMNGEPEFIVSGQSYSNGAGSKCYPISIYYLDDSGKFSSCPYIKNFSIFDDTVSGISAIISEPIKKDYKAGNYFDYPLYQNSDGKYMYLSAYMYDISYSIDCFDVDLKNCCQEINLMYFLDTSSTGIHIVSDIHAPEYVTVTLSELKSWYHQFFENMTPYKTITKTIDIENYKKMSDTEKKTALGTSYSAWSYEKDYATERPLESKINSIQ